MQVYCKTDSQQAPLYYVLYITMEQFLKLHIYIIGLHSFVADLSPTNMGCVPFQTACSCTVGAWTELRLQTANKIHLFEPHWGTLICTNKIRIALFGGEQNCFRMNASSQRIFTPASLVLLPGAFGFVMQHDATSLESRLIGTLYPVAPLR